MKKHEKDVTEFKKELEAELIKTFSKNIKKFLNETI